MKRLLFLMLLTLSASFLQAQDQTKDFEKFAIIQDSLCMQAYEKRDDKKFEKLLAEFLVKYNKLKEDDKRDYKSTLNGIYYNLCCLYALQNNKTKALDNLEKAIHFGYNNYKHTTQDTDLDNLRNEARYKVLINKVRLSGDYTYILKNAEKYNAADKREFPKFTYQSADNANLVALKKYFKLDSIAGGGNEVSQILNLLHWIHNLVPHDGMHGNPTIKNAMHMISVCKQEKRGLNCRGLATVLNECYLALGIKSRFITCMPKDSLQIDPDCHVINMVYSNTLSKWLWIDLTNDAYVMNEKGELLSIEEVRDRLINNKPLLLNPEANWNHKVSQTKEEYLETYMTKNLYKLQCPVKSEYDAETSAKGKRLEYVELLPVDYFNQKPESIGQTSTTDEPTYVYYKTNNPALFWQKP